MGVVRLSKSGNQVQFIDDDGRVFGAAKSMLTGVINGSIPLLLLARLPFDVAPDRFAKSPVWSGNTLTNDEGNIVKEFTTTSNDGLSVNRLKKEEDGKRFLDQKVEF